MARSNRKRRPTPNWRDDPAILAFATSINPAAAKLVRHLRNAWPRTESGNITDKGVLYEALSAGLHYLAEEHLRDPRAWKPGKSVSSDAELDEGIYVPVFYNWRNAEEAESRAAIKRLQRKDKERREPKKADVVAEDGLAEVIDLEKRRDEPPTLDEP